MPLNIPHNLPAIELLKRENIFVMDDERASTQDIRPLKVAIVNLMPVKITTETDFVRLLANSPLQVEVDFIRMKDHSSKNTSEEHLIAFYRNFEDIRQQNYDGLIVTGAPVELLEFDAVTYWNDLKEIFEWAHTHVTSSIYICWAAQAALHHFYGIRKYPLPAKMFGIFKHKVNDAGNALLRGFDDVFYAPHSRHTEIRKEDIINVPELHLLSESDESGVYIVMARGGREIFITGHSEYAPNTLHNEYMRDTDKGLPIEIPKNYYKNDDPAEGIIVTWRAHAHLLFKNWLNYYVYQATPFDPKAIENLTELTA
ncbi:MAG: Homoserine O-succinyltransferase [Candidatus Ordinivivax streblomastigis]|uniref:Homoserine O-acetyltransferase n=1 Tax=Candidatus Ordinivivax streblomastigis TaxID=2540710 RepID=A0A5M8P619_9BACT|nr:MAG: Homoserine O-succinyltransferase [Candidatus Ordinivivax streblomastigis]